jgi:hypothetical protein
MPVLLHTTPWKRIGFRDKAQVFLSTALEGDEWSATRPGNFTPEKIVSNTRYTKYRRQSVTLDRAWRGDEESSLPISGTDPSCAALIYLTDLAGLMVCVTRSKCFNFMVSTRQFLPVRDIHCRSDQSTVLDQDLEDRGSRSSHTYRWAVTAVTHLLALCLQEPSDYCH